MQHVNGPSPPADGIVGLAAENPVLVVGRRGCFMIHAVRMLLQGLGVNPAVCEVSDAEEEATHIQDRLAEMAEEGKEKVMFPVVFIGGRLVGGIDRLMAVHISGELVPILKHAGALWL